MPSTSRQVEDLPSGEQLRQRWPRGLLGALAFWFDHRLHGYDHPVHWPAVAAWEHAGMGEALFANGGVMILLGNEMAMARLLATGGSDQHVATQVRVSIHKVRRLRRALASHLGITQAEELCAVMTDHLHLP